MKTRYMESQPSDDKKTKFRTLTYCSNTFFHEDHIPLSFQNEEKEAPLDGSYFGFSKLIDEYIKKYEKTIDGQISYPFGNISKKEQCYFELTPQVQEYGKYFLRELFHEGNMDALQKAHLDKLEAKKLRDSFAACASFIHCRYNRQDVCYISPSYNVKIIHLLEEVANKIPPYQNKVSFYVITNTSIQYRQLLEETGRKLNIIPDISMSNGVRKKGCSEYFYVPVFAKHLADDPDFFIEGGFTCQLYPYDPKKNYGRSAQPNSIESRYIPPPRNKEKFVIDDFNHLYVPLINCCQTCKKYKKPALVVLYAAQKAGLQQKMQLEKKEIMSPFRNNFSQK